MKISTKVLKQFYRCNGISPKDLSSRGNPQSRHWIVYPDSAIHDPLTPNTSKMRPLYLRGKRPSSKNTNEEQFLACKLFTMKQSL